MNKKDKEREHSSSTDKEGRELVIGRAGERVNRMAGRDWRSTVGGKRR